MATSKFGSQMKKMVDDAPEAGFLPLNFGKLTVTPYVLAWTEDETGKRMPDRKELEEGHELQKGESFELLFAVDIAEFNPALEFKYERNVGIRKSRTMPEGQTPGPKDLTDWSEIVEPSLIAVFGADYLDKIFTSPYIEVEDIPNVAGRTGKKGNVFGVPKFLRVFKDRAECEAAHAEVFPKNDSGTANIGIPDEVITKTKGLLKSLKGNEKKVLEMLAKKPFGDYDPELVLTLAKA